MSPSFNISIISIGYTKDDAIKIFGKSTIVANVEVLKKIINQNNLKDFDDAKLLPSSIELESLI